MRTLCDISIAVEESTKDEGLEVRIIEA